MSDRETDVLIVGFGPVGAALANLLGVYGVRVLAIDKATEIFTAPRAIALDNEALRILQLAGLAEDAFARIAIPCVRMRSPYFGEFARIESGGEIDGHPKLVTFYQPELERALRAALARHAGVRIALGVELTGLVERGERVVATLRDASGTTSTVAAKYLVGADGASSRVRALIGQEFSGRTYAQDWLIVDAQRSSRPVDHVEFLCDPRRPTPHMPAPGGRERWEFMLRRGETREQMEREETMQALLRPWGGSGQLRIERKAVYRFHARCVARFGVGRVFLAGDAAHVTPPFAGQGLVAGLRDAANLAWKLAWVLDGCAAAEVLATYDAERRPHARAMIRLAQFLGRLIMPTSVAMAVAVHGLVRLLRVVPRLRAHFDDLGIKPKNVFARGLFVRGGASRVVRGGVLPQGWVREASGAIRLSDDVLGAELALVGFGVDPSQHLDADAASAFAAARGCVVRLDPRGRASSAGGGRGAEDLSGRLVPGFAPIGWAAVVRPDRTVLHDGPAADASRLVRESLALLGAALPDAPAAPVPT